MFTVNAQKGSVLLPQDLLRKAGEKYYPNVDFKVYCEPLSTDGEPYWAFDNYRTGGRIEGAPSFAFYTQPSWGLKMAEVMRGDSNVKCVTYACDPDIHKPVDVEKIYDVGFVGNGDDISDRKEYLDAINENFNCYISTTTPTEEMSNELSKCKVLFNHIRFEEINIRFFESLAIGAQVCSYKPSLNLFAEEGESYLTFNSQSEAIYKIQLLLDDEDRRNRMADSAREVALRNTYKHRAKEMLEAVDIL